MNNKQKIINQIVKSSGTSNPLKFVKDSVKDLCKISLNEHIKQCNDCHNECKFKSLTYGNPNASIMIIGNSFDLESSYNKRSKPFNKKDYAYIEIALNHLNISYNDIFFMNAVNCPNVRDLGNENYEEVIPTSTQSKNCKTFTDFAIDFVEPKVIILMSGVAVNSYLKGSPFELIGKWSEIKGIPTIVTHDPKHFYCGAWINRGQDFISEKQLEFLNDIKKVLKYIS